jgi:hypothetical protein
VENRIRARLVARMPFDTSEVPLSEHDIAVADPSRDDLRKFGLTMGAIIAVLFGLALPWLWGRPFPLWPWGLAAVFVGWALLAPRSLRLVYHVWMKFGQLISRITTPVILAIVFFLVITPIGVLRRWFSSDPLRRHYDHGAQSYRVASNPVKNMERPF